MVKTRVKTSAKPREWHQMSPKERCYVLFRKIDSNTRGLAKITSAVLYLTEECDVNVPQEVPDLMLAMRNLVRERRNLRAANEAELLNQRQAAQAAQAVNLTIKATAQ